MVLMGETGIEVHTIPFRSGTEAATEVVAGRVDAMWANVLEVSEHVKAGRLHLWIQNSRHTWKAVVDRAEIPPVSGTVTVPGFAPGAAFTAEWWDTWAVTRTARTERVVADASGAIVLDVPPLSTDVAVAVTPFASSPGSATKEH